MLKNTMSIFEGLCIMGIDLLIIFVPLVIMAIIFEETRIGRRIMRWVMIKMGIWESDWDDDIK